MKKKLFILFLILAAVTALAACGSDVKYPSKKALVSAMTSAGYTVEESDQIGDVTGIQHVIATKGSSILDICYKVPADKCSELNDSYNRQYQNSYRVGHNSSKGIVFFASDKEAWNATGIQSEIKVNEIQAGK